MIKYRSVREPVLYLVDEYFKNKQFINSQRDMQKKSGGINTDTIPANDNPPEYPVMFIQDENGRYIRAVYGNYEYLGKNAEADIRIWQEEFIYDADGDCVEISITYPDGETASLQIKYNDKKQAVEIK